MKSVFRFGGGTAEGDATQKELLGGKGDNLAEMAGIGLAVPPGLTIATSVCAAYYDAGGRLPDDVQAQVLDLLQQLVRAQGAAALIITHDLGIVAQYCDDMAIMFAGRVVERGPVAHIFAKPQHPYTRRLIAASRARIGTALTSMKSDPPDLFRQTTACVYADRCELVAAVCQSAPIEKSCSTAPPERKLHDHPHLA